jgi:hypothetical protein
MRRAKSTGRLGVEAAIFQRRSPVTGSVRSDGKGKLAHQ